MAPGAAVERAARGLGVTGLRSCLRLRLQRLQRLQGLQGFQARGRTPSLCTSISAPCRWSGSSGASEKGRGGPPWAPSPERDAEAAAEAKPLGEAPGPGQGLWTSFSKRWNEAANRRPLPLVIFFSGVATLNWAVIFGVLKCSSVAGAALAAPEFAVGWLVMRVTARLRVPMNAVAAAAVFGAFPSLSRLKVSPLLGVFAGDREAQAAAQRARRRLEENPHLSPRWQAFVKSSFRRLVHFGRWAEGPIDKYGLSYYLVARATSVTTLCGATVAAMHGLDVRAALSSWGLSGTLQSDAGLYACAAAMNVSCLPLHFLGAVGAIERLERFAARIWLEKQRELEEAELLFGRELSQEESQCKELSEAQVQHNFVTNVAYLTLLADVTFMFWIMWRMSSSQVPTDPDLDGSVQGGTGGEGTLQTFAEGPSGDPVPGVLTQAAWA